MSKKSLVLLVDFLIERNGEICLEGATIDAVHIVRGALVNSGVHLRCRVDFQFRLNFVRTHLPFVYLREKN